MRQFGMRIFTAAALSAGLLSAASAADMPLKAPAAVVANSWAGLYYGVSVGARLANPDWNTTCQETGFPGGNCLPFPARLPVNNPTNYNSTSARVGLFAGYNWQLNPAWIVGVEGDVAWGNNTKTISGIPGLESAVTVGAPGADNSKVKQSWDGGLRLRGGFLVNPSWLVYGTGGIALTDVESASFCGTAFPVGWCTAANVGRLDATHKTLTGWTVGGGLEGFIAAHWLLRAEYRYTDYGSFGFTHFPGPPATLNIDAYTANVSLVTHTILAGIAYKF